VILAKEEEAMTPELVEGVTTNLKGCNAMFEDQVLTIREVAAELRCSKAHVCNIINGKVSGVSGLPAITMGRRKLVRRATLDRWKRANERDEFGNAILSESPEVDAVRRA
jgi:excisionase family DNA binding protein